MHDNVDEIKDVIFEEFVNCQPSADGINCWWSKNYSRVLPTSRVVYQPISHRNFCGLLPSIYAMERGGGSSGNAGTGKPTKGMINWYWLILNTFIPHHSCPILSNRFHQTKQHSICCKNFLKRPLAKKIKKRRAFDCPNCSLWRVKWMKRERWENLNKKRQCEVIKMYIIMNVC